MTYGFIGRPLGAEAVRRDFEEFVTELESRPSERVGVVFGFAWGNEIYEHDRIELDLTGSELRARVAGLKPPVSERSGPTTCTSSFRRWASTGSIATRRTFISPPRTLGTRTWKRSGRSGLTVVGRAAVRGRLTTGRS